MQNEPAEDLKDFLVQNEVDATIYNNKPKADITYNNYALLDISYDVLINPQELKKTQGLMHDWALKQIEDLKLIDDTEYYLHNLSNKELYSIVFNQDDNSEIDYLLSIQILKKRGLTLDQDLLDVIKEEKLSSTNQHYGEVKSFILTAYIFAFLGGVVGIIMGHHFWKSRKTLPNGEKMFIFDEKVRSHGSTIFYLGLFCITLWLAAFRFL